eukprot:TRINITY_DN1045_c0_g1_i1.p1 TRINITY_DN1045_c0_g1~~TRINITY_DN1045_c0_g1_i1.p1  ORF type:complete len:213 (+),score=45.58 TRINITY_DN1045_c0_g1_i1:313-951(+)
MEELRLKVIVVGSLGTGKTSLIQRYVYNNYSQNYKSTVGVDFAYKQVSLDNTQIHLQLWDIAGQERFGSMTPVYYKGARGAVIVFDSEVTFETVDKWHKDIEEKLERYTDRHIPIMILYNKSDLINEQNPGLDAEVLDDFCEQYASKGVIGWKRTSAKESINVEESFVELMEAVISQRDEVLGKKPSTQSDDSSLVRVVNRGNSSSRPPCCS